MKLRPNHRDLDSVRANERPHSDDRTVVTELLKVSCAGQTDETKRRPRPRASPGGGVSFRFLPSPADSTEPDDRQMAPVERA